MKSVMTHQFSQIPQAAIPRSVFNRSNGLKTAFDAGYLVPIYLDEVLPGDTKNLNVTLFARLATPIVPVMDNLYLDTFFFFVPYRLIWDNWQKFNGEQENPGDSTDYIIPQMLPPVPDEDEGEYAAYGWKVGSLADYFGIPTGIDSYHSSEEDGWSVSALPFRAYNLIWNEWFRDQNLQDSAWIYKGDITETDTNIPANQKYPLRRRGKRHDYFTSCLPWPQKGPGVELQIGETAPVYGDGGQMLVQSLKNGSVYGLGRSTGSSQLGFVANDSGGQNLQLLSSGYYGSGVGRFSGMPNFQNVLGSSTSGWTNYELEAFSTLGGVPREGTELNPLFYATKQGVAYANAHKSTDPAQTATITSGLYADLTQAGAVTINAMREAFQIQKLYERDARGGTRYTEILRAHFGVISPDARLQRPEYLGGGSTRININPVAQSSSTNATTPQGNLAAFGVAASNTHGFTKSFVEHGIIIGLANVRADLNYQQGLDRFWSRKTRFDFYWPALAHLGEQPVYQKEIYLSNTADENESVFGYQERWAEYRYKNSQITGKLRSTANTGLDVWHLAQYFETAPHLNDEFIQDNPPVDRISAVTDEPNIILDAYFDSRDVRPMPVYSVPGLVDHF